MVCIIPQTQLRDWSESKQAQAEFVYSLELKRGPTYHQSFLHATVSSPVISWSHFGAFVIKGPPDGRELVSLRMQPFLLAPHRWDVSKRRSA